jgi:enoyl-CoA hydratase
LILRPTGPCSTAGASDSACRLVWRLECFSKPTVSLLDGDISGFSAGLVLAGTHRVAAENFRLLIEPAVIAAGGDGGLIHALARLGPRGAHLLLCGRALDRFEAHRLGLVTHCTDSRAFSDIAARLAEADPVDPLLDERHLQRSDVTRPPEPVEWAPLLARVFDAASIDEIRARLSTEPSATRHLAADLLADLARTPDAILAAALQRLRRVARMDLRETLLDGHRTAAAGAPPALNLPTRAEHQALRGSPLPAAPA